jgi:hypothetical protein
MQVMDTVPSPDRLTVWTVHPADFDLSKPGLDYDDTRGSYWTDQWVGERYKELLPLLHRHFQTSPILWCWPTLVRYYVEAPRTKAAWKLEVPETLILSRFDAVGWNAVVHEPKGTPFDLQHLDPTAECLAALEYEVLVRWPIFQPDSRVTRFELPWAGFVDDDYVAEIVRAENRKQLKAKRGKG